MLVGLGLLLAFIGLGMVFYGTSERQVFIDQRLDNITVYKAYPWSYTLGELPEGTYISTPGFLRGDVKIHLVETNRDEEVATVMYGELDFQTTRAGAYKLLLELAPTEYFGGAPVTDVTLSIQVKVHRLAPVYPLRPVGIGLVIAGVAVTAYTRRAKASTLS